VSRGKQESNKFVQICNDFLCGLVEMRVDYKVRDQLLNSIRLGLVSVLEEGGDIRDHGTAGQHRQG